MKNLLHKLPGFVFRAHPAILMFHSIEDQPGSKLAVRPDFFEHQLHTLVSQKYNVVSLESLVEFFRQKKKFPPKTVALTFDDGFKDNYIHAFTLLKKYRLRATIFLVTTWIGTKEYLTWDQIHEMEQHQIDFGSHTVTHPHLPSLSEKEVFWQLSESKKILEENLKKPSQILCYPFGGYTLETQRLTKEVGYTAAVSTSSDAFSPLDDLYALRRIRISNASMGFGAFPIQVSGYYSHIRMLQKRFKFYKTQLKQRLSVR